MRIPDQNPIKTNQKCSSKDILVGDSLFGSILLSAKGGFSGIGNSTTMIEFESRITRLRATMCHSTIVWYWTPQPLRGHTSTNKEGGPWYTCSSVHTTKNLSHQTEIIKNTSFLLSESPCKAGFYHGVTRNPQVLFLAPTVETPE